MVNVTYEHIVAIIIVGAIFVSAVVILPTLSFANFEAVDQQQLRNTALTVFNTMLLDTGLGVNGTHLTPDWGSIEPFDMDKVVRFGLANSEASSTFYVLDPFKVKRLVKGNPLGEISYTKVKELLGLQNYGFKFRIIPPFNVTNLDGTKIDYEHSPVTLVGSNLKYAIKVSYLDGRPIPNAEVEATIFFTTRQDFYIMPKDKAYTDSLGCCTKDIPISVQHNEEINSIIAYFRVTVANVATVVVAYKSEPTIIADINVVGDTITLTRTKDTPPSDAVWIVNGTYFSSSEDLGLVYLFNASAKNDKNYHLNTGAKIMWSRSYRGLSKNDPICFVFNFWAVDNNGVGRTYIVIAGPYENLMGCTVFEYGGNPKNAAATAKIQRSVIIFGMIYTAELWLWKES
jgi:hypothetical protein